MHQKRRRFTVASLLIIVSIGIIAGIVYANKDKVPEYTISIGTEADEFFGTFVGVNSGDNGYIQGRVLVRVNGNPVKFHSEASKIIPINQYIKPGKNRVSIEGDYEKQFYLRVIESQGDENTIVCDITLSPEANEVAQSCTFNANIEYELPLFKSDFEQADKEDIAMKAKEFALEILGHMKENNADKVIPILGEGFNVWHKMAYNGSDSDLEVTCQITYDCVSNLNNKFQPVELQDLKVIHGDNTILLYVDFMKNEYAPDNLSDNAYSIKYKDGANDKERRFSPLILIQKDGHFVCW
ncbi:MAG: hypothetical protein K9M57_06815 [Phycisphaerae bacterium]|nr:hypothetical protein [Phycisphaerae bacterium]